MTASNRSTERNSAGLYATLIRRPGPPPRPKEAEPSGHYGIVYQLSTFGMFHCSRAISMDPRVASCETTVTGIVMGGNMHSISRGGGTQGCSPFLVQRGHSSRNSSPERLGPVAQKWRKIDRLEYVYAF